MTDDKPRRISGRTFLRALNDAGIIHGEEDYVRRVVIDASVDGAVAVYVERWGDDRFINLVVPALASIVVDGPSDTDADDTAEG